MGYIQEPKGVDFTVINKEMTPAEKKKLSEFIAKRKKEILADKEVKTKELSN